MRLCRTFVIASAMVPCLLTHALLAAGDTPEPDPTAVRFVQRALPYCPDSTFELVENTRYQTPSGSYRVVAVERNCSSRALTAKPTLIIDEVSSLAWFGSVGQLPFEKTGVEAGALRSFVESFLPEALLANMNLRVRVEWDAGPHTPGALIPFDLAVTTGYGEFRREAAVTSDGKYLVLGSSIPVNEDPVAFRKNLLSTSEQVMWDSESESEPKLEIVEFSDLECPACRAKWPLIKSEIEKHGRSIRHGMVSFPLTLIHPWAFRAACASWCVAEQDAKALIPLKEAFYSLQREMEVSEVTPTAVDFVAGHDLDEEQFRACYLKEPSIAAVHAQMALAHRLNVHATPTYFVNGWMVQLPEESWLPDLLNRLLAGEDPY